MNHDVFISYSTRDTEIAEAVCESLEKDGILCWIAPRDIQPGQEYADAIIDALNTCRVFLVILSEESNSSPQVRREVERAVSKDLTILTFRIDNTILSKAMEYYLSNRHWLDASKVVFSNQLHSLSEAVKQLLGQFPVSKEESGGPKSYEVPKPEKPVFQTAQAAPATPVPTAVGQGSRKRSLGWLWAGGFLVLLLVLAAVVFFLLPGYHLSLALPGIATATSTPNPTVTPDYEATSQANSLNETADAREAWVHGFAEPILSQIAGRTPDFQDDFSDPDWSYSHWKFDGVSIENGQAVMVVTDQTKGISLTANTSDFIISFKYSITNDSSQPLMWTVGFNFRGDSAGQASNWFSVMADGWCGFGESGPASRNIILSESQTSSPGSESATKLTFIVQDDQAGAYINDRPLVNSNDILHAGNEVSIHASTAKGSATMVIDDVKLWNLK
jgi:hypothetical protein